MAGGGWNSFTKKFRCKFKPQVCDCCGGGVAAEQGCGRYTISLKDTSSKEIGVRRLQNIIAPVFVQEHSLPGGINGGSTAEGYWMGADQSYYYQAQRASSYYNEPQPQIETLPLFPVRSEEDNILIRNHFSQAYLDQARPEEEERRSYRLYGGDGASLELSLSLSLSPVLFHSI